MKNPLKSLVAVVALAGLSVAAYAQAPKILVVDMAKLYDNHYKTLDYNAKLQADDLKAQEEVGRLRKEINDMIEDYKKFREKNAIIDAPEGGVKVDNNAINDDAKRRLIQELRGKFDQIQAKENEGQKFLQDTQQTLRQRLQTFRSVMLEEIGKIASDMAKRKGATILVDKAGPTLIGIPSVLYVDGSIDITDEVLKELNKDRPATPTPAPATTPAATTPAPASTPTPAAETAPKIQLPGTPVKK